MQTLIERIEGFVPVVHTRVTRNDDAYRETEIYFQESLEALLAMLIQAEHEQRQRLIRDDIDDALRRYHQYCIEEGTTGAHYREVGATKTDFVDSILEMSKSKMPTFNDFNEYYGAAGWPLYSWVLLGTGNLSKLVCEKELNINLPGFVVNDQIAQEFAQWQGNIKSQISKNLSYKNFIHQLQNGKI